MYIFILFIEKFLKDFTGIDSAYEEPTNPEIIIDTSKNNIIKSNFPLINRNII